MARKLYSYQGETHSCAEWAQMWGVPYDSAYNRLMTLSRRGKVGVTRREPT